MTLHVWDELYEILHALAGGARYGFRIRLPHALVMTLLFKPHVPARAKLQGILRVALEHAGNLAAFATVYKSILALLKWTHRYLLVVPQTSDGSRRRNVNEGIFRWIGRVLLTKLGKITLQLWVGLWNCACQLFHFLFCFYSYVFVRIHYSVEREINLVDGPLIPGVEPALVRATDHNGRSPPGHPERSHHALFAGAVGGYLVWGRYSSVNNQIVLYVASRVLAGLCKRHLHFRLPESLRQRAYPLAAAVVWALVMLLFEEDPDVLHPSLRSSMEEIYRIRGKQDSSVQQSSGNESAER